MFNLSNANSNHLLPSEDHVLAALQARHVLTYHPGLRGPPAPGEQPTLALVVGSGARHRQYLRNGSDSTGDRESLLPATLAGDFRVFCPISFGDGARYVGGLSGPMFLVQEATTPSEVAAALRLFVAAIKHNAFITLSMESQLGYQVGQMRLLIYFFLYIFGRTMSCLFVNSLVSPSYHRLPRCCPCC